MEHREEGHTKGGNGGEESEVVEVQRTLNVRALRSRYEEMVVVLQIGLQMQTCHSILHSLFIPAHNLHVSVAVREDGASVVASLIPFL
jgi:hypothetical protein